MNDAKKAAIQTIDDHAALFCDVSRKIWEYAELSLKEFQSAALYEKVLAENGFAVTSNMGGIKTVSHIIHLLYGNEIELSTSFPHTSQPGVD